MESARTYSSTSREAHSTTTSLGTAGGYNFADTLLDRTTGRIYPASVQSDPSTDSTAATAQAGSAVGTGSTAQAEAAVGTGSAAQAGSTTQADSYLPSVTDSDAGTASSSLDELLDTMRLQSLNRISSLSEESLQQQIHNETLNYLLRLICGDDPDLLEALTGQSQNGATSAPGLYATAGGYGSTTLGMGATAGGLGSTSLGMGAAAGGLGSTSLGMGATALYVTTTFSYYEIEEEATTFTTTGTVNTDDGRSIDFNIEASMSRRFVSATESSYTNKLNLMDPLVINLDGNVTGVSDLKFYFDLDCDGEEESISLLSEGNAYLALDKNGDGQINDGSELFGTASGDGFADLAEYDEDANGWIDENDSIFSKLKVWSAAADGTMVLEDLKSAGVGALYLGSAQTEFTLKDAVSGDTDAVIRSTGLFLFEDGRAGTLQQVDLNAV